jgi:hypothetical protein
MYGEDRTLVQQVWGFQMANGETWFHVGLIVAVAVGYYLLWLFDKRYPWSRPSRKTESDMPNGF